MKKHILPLFLLTACTSKPIYTPDQEKIIKLAQHLEADSARYVPLRFSKPTAYTRADSLQPIINQYTELTDQEAALMMATAKGVDLAVQGGRPAPYLARLNRENDSVRLDFQHLSTARLRLVKMSSSKVVGQEVHHSWRVGERVDSARFVVFNNGAVKRL